MHIRPHTLTLLPLAVALIGAFVVLPADASDAHAAEHAAPAKPAAKDAKEPKPVEAKTAEAKAPEPKAAAVDPLQQVRDKLAEKLGAKKTTDSKTSYVMQVSSRTSGEVQVAAKPAAAVSHAPKVNVAALAAAHQASKEGGHGAAVHWSYEIGRAHV